MKRLPVTLTQSKQMTVPELYDLFPFTFQDQQWLLPTQLLLMTTNQSDNIYIY
jgi:hypothetical protein